MSERTTIGGIVYESIGSSSSNLLLKCNGTARIQWGNKLIDLIKNGKIVSESALDSIYIISDESEIKSDGIYILTKDDSLKLLVSKKGTIYNFTESSLYISASDPLTITVEQKEQALSNIGIYYNTLEELKTSGVLNGIAYILDTKELYTIKKGVIEEFKALIKTVTIEKENSENISDSNNSLRLVLSVLNDEYLVLSDLKIQANYSIHVKNSALIGSEEADSTKGYRLYIDGGVSYLEVDKINVRSGIPYNDYTEVTHEKLISLITFKQLVPHQWYLITDFQNHWKLPIFNLDYNRPILVRALTTSTFYEEGLLFKDRRVTIKYDPFYQEEIYQQITSIEGELSEHIIKTRGRILWMKDSRNNEANFDFLDYTDADNLPLTTLHESTEHDSLDKSIFPKFSYNNKLTIYDLYGTVIKQSEIINIYGETIEAPAINNENTNIVDFLFNDDSILEENDGIKVHDNIIECRGFVLENNCVEFSGNSLTLVCNIHVGEGGGNPYSFVNNTIDIAYKFTDEYKENLSSDFKSEDDIRTAIIEALQPLNTSTVSDDVFTESSLDRFGLNFENILDNVIFDVLRFNSSISNSYIYDFSNSELAGTIDNSLFKGIYNSYIKNSIRNCNFELITTSILNGDLLSTSFGTIIYGLLEAEISNCSIENLNTVLLLGKLVKVSFKNLESCTIESNVVIENASVYSDFNLFVFNHINKDSEKDDQRVGQFIPYTLYDSSLIKEVYFSIINKIKTIQVVVTKQQAFPRGMIVMHSGITSIPEGWAICDGKEYTYEGITSTTPNLVNRFIKAVDKSEDVKEGNNPDLNASNEFTLQEKHLPSHSHPHQAHTHSISDISGTVDESGDLTLTIAGSEKVNSITGYTTNVVAGADNTTQAYNGFSVDSSSISGTATGGNHTHNLSITGGSLTEVTSTESVKTWENTAFKMEPNYYSLIFIMKL